MKKHYTLVTHDFETIKLLEELQLICMCVSCSDPINKTYHISLPGHQLINKLTIGDVMNIIES